MYETIGSPVNLGNVTLKNRIVFAPTTLGVPNDAYLERIEKIAAGGCGMIIIGDVPVLSMPFAITFIQKAALLFMRNWRKQPTSMAVKSVPSSIRMIQISGHCGSMRHR